MKQLITILALASLVLGCSHVVSREYRYRADMNIPSSDLLQNPDAYRGRIIILGGTIASSVNKQEGTYIEVVEKPLNYRGRPKRTDTTRGRFLIFHEEYLDPAIFSRGRHVTVAGEVMGKKIKPLGEINYSYLLLRSRELHLIRPSEGIPVHFGIGVFHSF